MFNFAFMQDVGMGTYVSYIEWFLHGHPYILFGKLIWYFRKYGYYSLLYCS